jgi:ATP phosphoribosyltransferase
MSDKLILALPSKGRLMEQCTEAFKAVGLIVRKSGDQRGYRGELDGYGDVEVRFVSSSEIVQLLRSGEAHIGITGEDLVREQIAGADDRVEFLKPLGFGHADVVVAVPDCWIDVRTMADLELMAMVYRRAHGHRIRVATKYLNITRRFFAAQGVVSYRIVESLGATEGAPAAALAELIVDISTTGATLKANALRILDDGVILQSEANLIASRAAAWTASTQATKQKILEQFSIASHAPSPTAEPGV